MKKLVFYECDFRRDFMKDGLSKANAAIQAQEKFDKWFKENIESAPVVYHDKELDDVWTTDRHLNDTHTARLVDIEEIKKDCKHDPEVDYINNRRVLKEKCKHCGVELIAEWRVKP